MLLQDFVIPPGAAIVAAYATAAVTCYLLPAGFRKSNAGSKSRQSSLLTFATKLPQPESSGGFPGIGDEDGADRIAQMGAIVQVSSRLALAL